MVKVKYHNAEEMTAAFKKKGWSDDTSFSEVTMEEAVSKGYLFAVAAIANGEKIFRMNVCGNIYSETGKLLSYNIPTKKDL